MAKSSAPAVIELINAVNDSHLRVADVTLSDPLGPVGRETEITVKAVPGQGYRGELNVTYQRLGLKSIFGFFQPKLEVYTLEVDRMDLILGKIYERYGVRLPEDEVTITAEPTDNGLLYTVVCEDTSLQFVEDATFDTTVAKSPIDIFVIPTSPSFVYPLDVANRAFARVYSGGWYLKDIDFDLSIYQVGQLADDNLQWITQTVSGNSWVRDTELTIAYNIAEAVVVYNGPVNEEVLGVPGGRSLLMPPEIAENVLIVELNDRLCPNMVGKLTYYY